MVSRISPLPVLFLFATAYIKYAAAAFVWNSFPECAQPLYQLYAPSICDFGTDPGSDLNRTNSCLCSNQTFFIQSAVAIYLKCGCDDLSLSATQLVFNCLNLTNIPPVFTVDQLVLIGDGNQTSCTQLATSPANQNQSGPNTDLIVGLALGIPGGIFALLTLVVGVLQLLVSQRILPEGSSPWPTIRDSLRQWCCCCARRRPKPSLQAQTYTMPNLPVNQP